MKAIKDLRIGDKVYYYILDAATIEVGSSKVWDKDAEQVSIDLGNFYFNQINNINKEASYARWYVDDEPYDCAIATSVKALIFYFEQHAPTLERLIDQLKIQGLYEDS